MAVEEADGKGHKRRTTVDKDSGRGTPQGAPISPLMANLYLMSGIWKRSTYVPPRQISTLHASYEAIPRTICYGSAILVLRRQ